MKTLISICIPTYNRSSLIRMSVESAIGQTYPAIEVIVSDDSPDDRTELALADLINTGKVRYFHNKPALGQARNINQLFDLSSGDLLVLLHDDDLLLPEAVTELSACFDRNPHITAAFGKQYLIDLNGVIDEPGSIALNEAYKRTASSAGMQTSCLLSALTAQFPNDGFMVRTKAAREVKYRDDPEVGDACDFDFGLRLAAIAHGFYFSDQYLAKYRKTGVSVSAGNNYAHITFNLLATLSLPDELEPIRSERLRAFASPAINRWLTVGNGRSALQVYMSPVYRWSKWFTPEGLVQGVLIICPAFLGMRLVSAFKWLRGGS